EAVLKQPNLFSSNPSAGYFGSESGAIPLQVDPPDHVAYRRLLDPLFAPKKMEVHEAKVAALCNQLIDEFIERGQCDFIADFAMPLPSTIFLSLMGLSLDDLHEFLAAKEGMIRPEGKDEAERRAHQEVTSAWIFTYFSNALDERAKDLQDDLLSWMLGLEAEGRLTRDETLNICLLLLAAGLDTVTDTLGCAYLFLAQHPDHQKQLEADPSLMAAAVEELMRFDTPVPSVSRIATADTVVAGCPVKEGQRVRVLLSQSNTDPATYERPDEVDFLREGNRHIAFGAGVHRCLGSHLARLELRVAMREWHRRIPSYRMTDGFQVEFRQGLREVVSLPLEFAPGPRQS
ncbi:MAG: cytochrome, partial [Acidimicrobiia bacterium]|nr:cytochrome [Acidimicrobiia bacterium]